jgi:CDP-6-deoxy-D-xylo-4-hexulose-3-dehydrase
MLRLDNRPSVEPTDNIIKPCKLIENKKFSRDQIVEYLESKFILTRSYFAGNILKQPAYSDVKHRVVGELTNTDLITTNTFWIGVYPGLTDPMIDYMIESIDEFMRTI